MKQSNRPKKYQRKGEHKKSCEFCNKEMIFDYACYLRRKFCSPECYRMDLRRRKITNQYGTFDAWTKEEENYLIEKFPTCLDVGVLAKEMGKTEIQIVARCVKLNVRRNEETRKIM